MKIIDLHTLAQLPLEIDLLAIHELEGLWSGSFYHVPMNEMFFNVSDHSKKPFSLGLAWSSTGFVYSTHQRAPHFDLHAEYQRKMAMPPDKDPLGRAIPRPCYWYDVGNGKGFIRGNGMNNFALDSRIAINSQFLHDRGETVVFAFGKPPYGPIQDKELFIR